MFLHQIGVYSWNWLQISESFLHLQSRIWAGEKEDLEFYLSLEELCLLLGHNRNARPVKRQFTRWSCCQLMGLIITSLASNAAIAKEHLRCFCYAYINYNLVFTLWCLLFVHIVLVLKLWNWKKSKLVLIHKYYPKKEKYLHVGSYCIGSCTLTIDNWTRPSIEETVPKIWIVSTYPKRRR